MLSRTVFRLSQNATTRLNRTLSGLSKPYNVLKSNPVSKEFIRKGGDIRVGYRCLPPEDPLIEFSTDVVATFIWCYIFYMAYHNGDKVTGYGKVFADDFVFTDADLGIEE